ncbi:hypothetical protein FQA23_0005775, partial [Aptenodytes patagonicus]
MAPMIEHLSGYKHRRAYISKEFPDKMKRKTTDVKECKVSFLRRIAGELEKTEGLKMYKVIGSKCKVSGNVSFISAFMFDLVNFKRNSNWNQGFLSQYEECSADASFAPANSYSYQTDDGSSSYGLRSNDFAMMSALRDSFALQTGSPAGGISEWLRLFNRS